MKSRERLETVQTTVASVLGLLASLLVLAVPVLPLVLAPGAEAFIHWTSGAIGRAELDGTNVDRAFITDTSAPYGVAVSASHLYWADSFRKIGRAERNGANVQTTFLAGVDGAEGVAVDDHHVYWAHSGAVGRAKLDGTGVDESFIVSNDPLGMNGPAMDLAVDDHHVYWTQGFTIARADLDGTDVDQAFITDANSPRGLAVDQSHLYWTDYYAGSIGRASLDGVSVEPKFISGLEGDYTTDVAVNGDHVYWGQYDGNPLGDKFAGRIGRANLDGTNVDQALISLGDEAPQYLALDRRRDTKVVGGATATKTQNQAGKRIVVRIEVKVQETVTARASGKIEIAPTYKLMPETTRVAAGKAKTLKLCPKKAAAKKIAAALKRIGRATAKLSVKLTDGAGNTKIETVGVKLTRR